MAVQIDLTDNERSMLLAGINEWFGPASVTNELALAIGFKDRDDLHAQGVRLRDSLKSGSHLEAFDWARVLVMTEFVFASNVFGSGLDWSITTGIPDTEAIQTLRDLQRKFGRVRANRNQFGPTSHQEFQWHSGAATAIRIYERGRSDLPALVSALGETVSSFGDDLADLETTRANLALLLELPEDHQRPAALAEFARLKTALSDRLGNPSRRRFWI